MSIETRINSKFQPAETTTSNMTKAVIQDPRLPLELPMAMKLKRRRKRRLFAFEGPLDELDNDQLKLMQMFEQLGGASKPVKGVRASVGKTNDDDSDRSNSLIERESKAKHSDFFVKLHHLKEKIALMNDVFIGEEVSPEQTRRRRRLQMLVAENSKLGTLRKSQAMPFIPNGLQAKHGSGAHISLDGSVIESKNEGPSPQTSKHGGQEFFRGSQSQITEGEQPHHHHEHVKFPGQKHSTVRISPFQDYASKDYGFAEKKSSVLPRLNIRSNALQQSH